MNKPTLACALLLGISLALNSCSTKTASEQGSDSAEVALGEAKPAPVTVCTWNELNVRETPSEKGKYLTSIYLNEPVTLTGDTASEKSGSKSLKYHKVTLSDGKSGWVRDEFIAIDVFPGAVKNNNTSIYKRPDISTVTEKKFNSVDYVVAKEASPGWFEVTGKPVGEKWFVSGYVQAESLLLIPIEAQYAALSRRAAEATKPEMTAVLQGQLADGSVFGSSILFQWWTEAQMAESEEGEEVTDPGMMDLWYLFKGNALDMNGGNAGTVFGAQLTDDPWGNKESAYHFDGMNYIQLPLEVRFRKPAFSVGVLFKADDLQQTSQCLVSQGQSESRTGFSLDFGGDGTNGAVGITFHAKSTLSMGAPLKTPANTNWQFVVVTYDGRIVRLYVDTELGIETAVDNAEAAAIESNLLNTNMPIEIGRDLSTRHFRGTIDQVFVFNRVLTAEDVKALNLQN